jgi:glycosyltransferase involved in cell wall biosynthesis
MRVLMITSDHLMIDRRIIQEAHTLRGAGYEVELLAGFECPEPQEYDLSGVRVSRFTFDWSDTRIERLLTPLALAPGPLRTLLWRGVRPATARLTGLTSFEHYVLRKVLAREYDILHCHDYPMLAPAVAAKRRRPTPLVYDAHELYHAQVQLPERTQRRYRARERRLIRHADLAITVNPFLADIMAKDYGCATPAVILNAAPAAAASAAAGLHERLNLSPRDRIVLYQGWMSPERGIDKLVRAAQYFPANVRLVLVGYGDYVDHLREISAAQGTSDGRVVFFGRVEPEDLPPLTRSADLGVIPYQGIDLNHLYSSPNKLFEYAAVGLPFVCNDLPFLRSVISQFGFGVAAPLADPQQAAKTILALLQDEARLAAMKEAARAAYRVLNWNVEGGKLLALYEQVIRPRVRLAKAEHT